jgi:hypothetical protein
VVLDERVKSPISLMPPSQCAQHAKVRELLLQMKKDESPLLASAWLAYRVRDTGESVLLQQEPLLLQERVSKAFARLASA